MFKSISKILFGEKIVIEDSKLGSFETKIRSNDSSKLHTWTSTNNLFHPKIETVILLEFPLTGILENKRNDVLSILNNYSVIKSEIFNNHLIKTNNINEDDFYLSYIGEYPENKLELNFENIDSKNNIMITAIWSKMNVSEIEVLK